MSAKNLEDFDPTRFDYVVVDEFHHAEAPTYNRLFDYFQPRELLGLTATPERMDGQRGVIEKLWPPTYELRLWHALERNLLCPFHYFGIDDGTDLSTLAWSSGQYQDAELETAFIEKGTERSRVMLREFREKIDPTDMRVVAFCATIRHADYVAKVFRDAGYSAESLHSGLTHDDRHSLVKRFRQGELPIICTVDLFNEGVDIPEINTVLFLRPTESATVFIQQLGRGLRNHWDKGALTVLDFVGQQNKNFRMDLRFRAMTGLSRLQIKDAIEKEFPYLPAGCDIRLDRVTSQRVLDNLKQALPSSIRQLTDELRRLSLDGTVPSLGKFLAETSLEPEDLYRSDRSYLLVREKAGLYDGEIPSGHHRVGSMVHVDDRARALQYQNIARGTVTDIRFERMLSHPITEKLSLGSASNEVREELAQLMEVLHQTAHPLPVVAEDLPFALHASYNRDEIVSPFRDNPKSMRQGTFYVKDFELDVHLVTLRKSDRDFSPTTRYDDWFESPEILHWESQSTTKVDTPTGQRLINGMGRHLIFVREFKDDPFLCIGFAKLISYESEMPIRIRWKLDHSVPDHIYIRLRSASG